MYRQIADNIRAQILESPLAPGAKLPSTDQLCQSYGGTVTVSSQA